MQPVRTISFFALALLFLLSGCTRQVDAPAQDSDPKGGTEAGTATAAPETEPTTQAHTKPYHPAQPEKLAFGHKQPARPQDVVQPDLTDLEILTPNLLRALDNYGLERASGGSSLEALRQASTSDLQRVLAESLRTNPHPVLGGGVEAIAELLAFRIARTFVVKSKPEEVAGLEYLVRPLESALSRYGSGLTSQCRAILKIDSGTPAEQRAGIQDLKVVLMEVLQANPHPGRGLPSDVDSLASRIAQEVKAAFGDRQTVGDVYRDATTEQDATLRPFRDSLGLTGPDGS